MMSLSFKFFIVLIVLLVGGPLYAVVTVKAGTDVGADFILNQKEGFFKNSAGHTVYGVKVLLREKFSDKLGAQGEGLEIQPSEDKFFVLIGAADSKLNFKMGTTKKTVEFKWESDRKGIVTEKCTELSPRLIGNKKGAAAPFPMALHCWSSNNTILVTLSTLEEVDLQEADLFELEGKGERWKVYEIPAASAGGSSIGEFRFSYKNESYAYRLLAPKEKNQVAEEKKQEAAEGTLSQFQNILGVGFVTLGVDAGDVKVSDSKPLIKYSVVSNPFWNRVRFGGSFAQSFSMSEKAESVEYSDGRAYASYFLRPTTSSELGFKALFMFVNITESSSGAGLQSSQVGIDVDYDMFINEKNRVNVHVGMASFGSAVLKSHMEIGLSYKYRLGTEKNPYWLGLGYGMQTFEAENTSGEKRKFTENDIMVTLGF